MKKVWLTVPEAAEHLGVTERWMRRQIDNRTITFRKLGGNIHFNVHVLDQLSDEFTFEATRPPQARGPRRHRATENDAA